MSLEQMLSDGLTCVIEKDGKIVFFSDKSGIRPLIEAIENGTDCVAAVAYDKIVGKAAAFLYAVMGVRTINCAVLSAAGEKILKKYGIEYSYKTLTERIINRRGDGQCPMENAVEGVEDKDAALPILREKILRK